jgi:ribonuclease HI
MIKNHPGKDLSKGKFILDKEEMLFHSQSEQTVQQSLCWTKPAAGWCKLNTDGSFDANGKAGAGMLARDSNGEIIFSACRQLLHCKDPFAAELLAVLEGVSLALHWCNSPLDIEVDCLEIVKALNQEEMDRSAYSSLIEELKTLLKVRQTCITHVRRG